MARVNPQLFDLAARRVKAAFVPSDAAAGPPPGAPPGMPPGPPMDPAAMGAPPGAPPGMPPGPPMDPSMMGAPPGGPPPGPPSGGVGDVDIDSKIQRAVQSALQGAGMQGNTGNPKQPKPDINTIATDIFQMKKMVQHDLRLRGVELPPEVLDGPNRDPMTGAAAVSPSGGSDVPAGASLAGGSIPPIKPIGEINPAMGKAASVSQHTWPSLVKAAAELLSLRAWQLELDLAKTMVWREPEPSVKVAAQPEASTPVAVGTEYGGNPHRHIADKAAAIASIFTRRRQA